MKTQSLAKKADAYLQRLCLKIPSRRVGSEGNRTATRFFADCVASFGFEPETPAFDCLDWTEGGADLTVGGTPFDVSVSPYSLGCEVSAPLAIVSTVEELEAIDAAENVLLVKGDLAREQLMPKSFPFYNPDRHKRIIQLLETKNPQAIVAATSRDTETAGAVYPFPLIEDGDFDIPSVYMKEEEGHRLSEHVGQETRLEIRAQRTPAKGYNVVARKGPRSRRVVLFAHIDAKDGSPGATDNATGVTVLLLLAEMLQDDFGSLGVEIVALNGEDYYSNPGERQYLEFNAGRFSEIVLGINMDGIGYQRGDTAYSLYKCPSPLDDLIHTTLSVHKGLIEGPPWYQGDHYLFLVNERPALALTSERVNELLSEFVHTPQDSPEIVDPTKIVDIAIALRDLLLQLFERA